MKSMIKGLVLLGFCVAPGLLLAQEQTGTGKEEQQGSSMHQRMSHQISSQTPTDLNRTTKIVGTDVMNQTNTKLGVVRDIVVDPKSQRVAYAWVEKSTETGNTGKYLAVPINLLTPSTDQKILTLNIDKERFDSAQGFAKHQMPNMAMTPNQMSFWRSISEASGAQPQPQQQP